MPQHWPLITISELYPGTEVLRRKEKKTAPRKEAAHAACVITEAAVRGSVYVTVPGSK